MVRDRTGRFPERPHYEPAELDVECERFVTDFLSERHGRVQWPVMTDDLMCLLEREVADLDLYADLSDEGADVEGVTEFRPGHKPRVRISAALATADHRAHRLRTTLTHELGHVHLHGFLFELRAARLDLFDTQTSHHSSTTAPVAPTQPLNQKCRRGGIINASEVDWMEWQAGYACGAFLMPAGPLRDVVRQHVRETKSLHELVAASPEGAALIARVAEHFDTSHDAARVRLIKTKHLVQVAAGPSVF
jgi:hypothetical protein